jgi:hypothetical protein
MTAAFTSRADPQNGALSYREVLALGRRSGTAIHNKKWT